MIGGKSPRPGVGSTVVGAMQLDLPHVMARCNLPGMSPSADSHPAKSASPAPAGFTGLRGGAQPCTRWVGVSVQSPLAPQADEKGGAARKCEVRADCAKASRSSPSGSIPASTSASSRRLGAPGRRPRPGLRTGRRPRRRQRTLRRSLGAGHQFDHSCRSHRRAEANRISPATPAPRRVLPSSMSAVVAPESCCSAALSPSPGPLSLRVSRPARTRWC